MIAENYTYNLATEGEDYDDQIAQGGEACPVSVPAGNFLNAQVAGCPSQPGEEGQVNIPFWWMKLAFSQALGYDLTSLDPDAFAGDHSIHVHTLSFAAQNAEAAGFHRKADGTLKYWKSVEHVAADLFRWAVPVRNSERPSPATTYQDDIVSLDAYATFPQEHDWLNHIKIVDMATETGNAVPWMQLQMMLYPFEPFLDLTDPLSGQSIVATFLAATAKASFPELAAASLKLAIIKLLSTDVPYQVLPSTPWGPVPSVVRRTGYISLLARWASPNRNEPLIVQDCFADVLTHSTVLESWVDGLPDKHAAARQLYAGGWNQVRPLDLAGVAFLCTALQQEYEGLRSEERSPQENFDYLLS